MEYIPLQWGNRRASIGVVEDVVRVFAENGSWKKCFDSTQGSNYTGVYEIPGEGTVSLITSDSPIIGGNGPSSMILLSGFDEESKIFDNLSKGFRSLAKEYKDI